MARPAGGSTRVNRSEHLGGGQAHLVASFLVAGDG
jgi:hypothetical protein